MIILKGHQVRFLIKNIKNKLIVSKIISFNTKKGNSLKIQFEKEEMEKITDELSSLLTKKGLGPNDEPNHLGIYIDELIGLFNPYDEND